MHEHDHDPYRPPQAVLPPREADELAGRMERLGASIIDSMIMVAATLPMLYFGGFFRSIAAAIQSGQGLSLALVFGWSLAGFVLFVLVQGVPLYRDGQTWGKKVAGIRIVDLKGEVPNLVRIILLRYLAPAVVGQVPLLGMLFGIADSLFIFRDDRRCIHDFFAGTRVVVAR